MYTSTARIYKCNISDWIALVTGNILEMCSFNMAEILKKKLELLFFHHIQDSPQKVLAFTNIYKDIGTRVSKFML